MKKKFNIRQHSHKASTSGKKQQLNQLQIKFSVMGTKVVHHIKFSNIRTLKEAKAEA